MISCGELPEYTIENKVLKVTAIAYGASITGIYMKNREGKVENIVASFQDLKDYEEQGGPYLNAIVGPSAGRIAYGRYQMDDQIHQLSRNSPPHHLHGGASGISKKMFTLTQTDTELHFHLETTHEEDGYPAGTYVYDVIYRLQGSDLIMELQATPPAHSLLYMTSHLYFNLSGNMKEDILHHELTLPSHHKAVMHPDGHPYAIEEIPSGSPFDFTQPIQIQKIIDQHPEEFAITKALDTPFLLEKGDVILYHKESGRELRMRSDANSVVVYTANYFDEALIWEQGNHGYPLCAVALEPQELPNGVNIPDTEVHPFADENHPFQQTTTYHFSIR